MPNSCPARAEGLKYRAAIIDDDPGATERLRKLLSGYEDIEITATCTGYTEAIETLTASQADIVFVDIALPDGDGQDLPSVIRKLPGMDNAYMIMYTAFYRRSATDGRVFEDGTDDYLLKPIDEEALDVCMQRFHMARRQRLQTRGLATMTTQAEDNRVLVVLTTTTSEMRVIKVKDIGYFHYNSSRKVWEAVLTDNTAVQLKKTSTSADILSYSPTFLQTHQSYIVNLDYVMLIGKQRINLYPPFEKDEVLVGRTYLRSLQAKFMCL